MAPQSFGELHSLHVPRPVPQSLKSLESLKSVLPGRRNRADQSTPDEQYETLNKWAN